MRTVAQLLKTLPEHSGCGDKLRNFWSCFCAVDVRPLLNHDCRSKDETLEAIGALDQVQERLLLATYPFKLVTELLLNKWKPREASHLRDKPPDAASAALEAELDAEQFNCIQIVQRVAGRLNTPSPSWQNVGKDIQERKDRYLSQAWAFHFIAAALTRTWDQCASRHSKDASSDMHLEQIEQIYSDKVKTLIVVQQAVPKEWRGNTRARVSG